MTWKRLGSNERPRCLKQYAVWRYVSPLARSQSPRVRRGALVPGREVENARAHTRPVGVWKRIDVFGFEFDVFKVRRETRRSSEKPGETRRSARALARALEPRLKYPISNIKQDQPARASTAAPATTQPHTALCHCAQSPRSTAEVRGARLASTRPSFRRRRRDYRCVVASSTDLPHHNTRTRRPTRTTPHANERTTADHNHETGAPRALPMWTTHENNGETEAKHVTRITLHTQENTSETRHRKRNTS